MRSEAGVEALAGVIDQILANTALLDHLCKKDLAQAVKFSWRRTAQETLDLYREILP